MLMAEMALSSQLRANMKRPVFLGAAKTMQTANANGGAGGDGVKLGKDGFPDSFILIGAVAETPAPAKFSSAQSAC